MKWGSGQDRQKPMKPDSKPPIFVDVKESKISSWGWLSCWWSCQLLHQDLPERHDCRLLRVHQRSRRDIQQASLDWNDEIRFYKVQLPAQKNIRNDLLLISVTILTDNIKSVTYSFIQMIIQQGIIKANNPSTNSIESISALGNSTNKQCIKNVTR